MNSPALPPLPEPDPMVLPTGWVRYTAAQMHDYARAALAQLGTGAGAQSDSGADSGHLARAVQSDGSTARYVWCCANGCGMCKTRPHEFETFREETLEGVLLARKTVTEQVSACCGAGIFLWDNEQDREVTEAEVAALATVEAKEKTR